METAGFQLGQNVILGTVLNPSDLISKKRTNSLLLAGFFFFFLQGGNEFMLAFTPRSSECTPGLQNLLTSVIIGKCVGGASKQD